MFGWAVLELCKGKWCKNLGVLVVVMSLFDVGNFRKLQEWNKIIKVREKKLFPILL